MHPILFHVGKWPITSFGVLMVMGFAAGFLNWLWLGRKDGRDANDISDMLFWIMMAGVIGARLAYVAADWPFFVAHPEKIVRVDEGGLIFYGGAIGALIALILMARRWKERPLKLLDFVVTSLPLGHAFGRIGCFLNGCCFGTPTHGPMGVAFPRGSLPWLYQHEQGLLDDSDAFSIPVHPVQLYEAALNVVTYMLLVLLYRKRKCDGIVFACYLLTYPTVRFFLEFLRGDEREVVPWMFGLNVAQCLSVFLFVAGLVLSLRCIRTGKRSSP